MFKSWKKRQNKPLLQKSKPLEEGKDYYIENGLYVFTAYYLQKRGYCCGNQCRHCPYSGGKKALDKNV